MNLREQYEAETGNPALYMGNYRHGYSAWLEAKVEALQAACKRAEVYLTLGVKLGDENRAAALLDTLNKLRAVALEAGEAKGGG